MSDLKQIVIGVSLFIFALGIGNGVFSTVGPCYSQYLNFRKPIHYVAFPHTIGFYVGRILNFPYGEDRSYTSCENIFNHTIEGPKDDY